MSWGFIWLMVVLKIPIAALILIVWWALRQKPDDAPARDDDGGSRLLARRLHPGPPFPRHPRRGPHGDPATPAPARVRTVHARSRLPRH